MDSLREYPPERTCHGHSPGSLAKRAETSRLFFGQSPQKTLHCFYLAEELATLNTEALEAIKKPSESYGLVGQVFYLPAPDGIGKSRLAERTERLLGVNPTARNWRMVHNVLEMSNLP